MKLIRNSCLVHQLNHIFSVFKQHYSYFHTVFFPQVFPKKTENGYLNASTKRPSNCNETKIEYRYCSISTLKAIFLCEKKNQTKPNVAPKSNKKCTQSASQPLYKNVSPRSRKLQRTQFKIATFHNIQAKKN